VTSLVSLIFFLLIGLSPPFPGEEALSATIAHSVRCGVSRALYTIAALPTKGEMLMCVVISKQRH
jgi:hypothetical protein